MCKAINQALVNMTENYDFLGKFGVDDIDISVEVRRGTRRPANRAERRKATAHAKNRRQNIAKYADDIITNTGKVKDSGYRSYEKGDKAWSRKIRYEKLPDYEDDVEIEVPDFWTWFTNSHYDQWYDIFVDFTPEMIEKDAMWYYVQEISHEDLIDPVTGEVLQKYLGDAFAMTDDEVWLAHYIQEHEFDVYYYDLDESIAIRDEEGWTGNKWRFDPNIRQKLHVAKRLIAEWEQILEAEKIRAELQARIHEINRDLNGMYMAHAKTLCQMNK